MILRKNIKQKSIEEKIISTLDYDEYFLVGKAFCALEMLIKIDQIIDGSIIDNIESQLLVNWDSEKNFLKNKIRNTSC